MRNPFNPELEAKTMMDCNLFDEIFENAKSSGTDDFPSCDEWKKEVNKWLLFIQDEGQIERFKPRFQKCSNRHIDKALAEISSAYVMGKILNYPIISWEEKTVGNQDVEFVIKYGKSKIFCEVKSVGWESELDQEERVNSPRKELPKYLSGEGRSVAPWESIRHGIKKSYSRRRHEDSFH